MADPVEQAQPKRVKIAWLTLSLEPTAIGDRFYLSDLFKKVNPETKVLEKINPKDMTKLWEFLANQGYYLHPELEGQYLLQRICIWCGGDVLTYNIPQVEGFEERCSQCSYLYGEG